MNNPSDFAHSTIVNEYELWTMFAKTGDVEWYNMYRAMKDYRDIKSRRKDKNANSRPKN